MSARKTIKGKCRIDFCNELERTNGYCNIHYRRWLKHGDPLKTNKRYGNILTSPQSPNQVIHCTFKDCKTTKIRAQLLCDKHYRLLKKQSRALCSIIDCNIQCDRSEKWCNKHYQRYLKHGDPTKLLVREKGEGTITSEGYKVIYSKGHPNAKKDGRMLEHRFIMSELLGRPLLDNENVHHKNGNKLDNRPENLELWVRSQPCGQRADDLVVWAKQILHLYKEFDK